MNKKTRVAASVSNWQFDEGTTIRSLCNALGQVEPPSRSQHMFAELTPKVLEHLGKDPKRISNIRTLFGGGIFRNLTLLRDNGNAHLASFAQLCDNLRTSAPRHLRENSEFVAMLDDFRQMLDGSWVHPHDRRPATPLTTTKTEAVA